MARHKHTFGWRRSNPDFRDEKFAISARKAVRLPRRADLRSFCSPIDDQGPLGSCVEETTVGALGYYANRGLWNKEPAGSAYSALFGYWVTRRYENCIEYDSGLEPRDALKMLAKYGACYDRLWPYDVDRFRIQPSTAAFTDAKKRLIKSYHAVAANITAIRQLLSIGTPVLFGATLYDSFESAIVAKTGVVPVPKAGEKELGGHMMLFVGYDDTMRRLIARNSWSARWGDRGYAYIPYAWVEMESIGADYWAITP